MALYAQTTGTHSTNTGSFVPIPGLTYTLPEGVGISALVILNCRNPTRPGRLSEGDAGHFGERRNIARSGFLDLQ
jgi:hypothetical protein